VAKTRFQSLTIPSLVAEVLRGESHNPLFVTAIGLDLATVAEKIQKMSGPYRIPELLKKVDELSRL
jgi:deoxyribonuclease V